MPVASELEATVDPEQMTEEERLEHHYRVGGPLDLMYRAVMDNDPAQIDAQLANPDADIDVRGPEGQTPLFFGVMKGKVEAVKHLIRRGADPHLLQDQGFGPLDAAGFAGRAKIAKYFITLGLDPHKTRVDGFNAMHRAIWGNTPAHTATVKVFLEAGVPATAPVMAAKFGAQTKEVWVTPLQMIENNDATKALLEEWIKTA